MGHPSTAGAEHTVCCAQIQAGQFAEAVYQLVVQSGVFIL